VGGQVKRIYSIGPPEERFWKHVEKTETCWIWTGAKHHGYGHFNVGKGKIVRAHVYAFRMAGGVIPRGKQLDHLCRNRACIRFGHLEPVTRRENILRGVSPCAHNARKTHCPKGHLLSKDNIYKIDSSRMCKTCGRERDRKRYRMARELSKNRGQLHDPWNRPGGPVA
jgi:hypothetical protein